MKKNQLPKVVTGVKFCNEYGGIVADNSCFIIARDQLSRLTLPRQWLAKSILCFFLTHKVLNFINYNNIRGTSRVEGSSMK